MLHLFFTTQEGWHSSLVCVHDTLNSKHCLYTVPTLFLPALGAGCWHPVICGCLVSHDCIRVIVSFHFNSLIKRLKFLNSRNPYMSVSQKSFVRLTHLYAKWIARMWKWWMFLYRHPFVFVNQCLYLLSEQTQLLECYTFNCHLLHVLAIYGLHQVDISITYREKNIEMEPPAPPSQLMHWNT